MAEKRIIHDLTRSLSESILLWPGDPAVSITQSSVISNGAVITISHLSFGAHTGTHVDAPAHFIEGGGFVDSLDLDLLIGEVLVVDAGDADEISEDLLEGCQIPGDTKRVLFRTKNSSRWVDKAKFTEGYVGLTHGGAQWLVSHGVGLVGTDYLSVCSMQENERGHETLLQAGVIIVESLDLSEILPGSYELVCLPLKIAGAEGAPARVILVEHSV